MEREDVVLTEADKKLYMTMFTPVLVSYVKLNVGDYIGEGTVIKIGITVVIVSIIMCML